MPKRLSVFPGIVRLTREGDTSPTMSLAAGWQENPELPLGTRELLVFGSRRFPSAPDLSASRNAELRQFVSDNRVLATR